ncbi:MAG: right-handed parallel beta-helix repeat-containing protein [Solirubrobacteraceae bacterium]
MTRAGIGIGAMLAVLLLAGTALAHPERQAFFPDGSVGEVPGYRGKAAQILTVCKKDSKQRIRRSFKGNRRKTRLRLRQLASCRFRHVQSAVDRARNGAIIRVMPGVYEEEPSRRNPEPDPRCAGDYDEIGGSLLESGVTGEGGAKVSNYEYQRKCPNAQNLIAIIGDSDDPDRVCDVKCDVQIQGMGRRRGDVIISGQRTKLNVIRADRADGIHLRNFTVEFSDFNNVYILETNGFAMERIQSRYSREYGFLSFTSDHGLYNRLEAFGSGDSGIYPGSGPEGHCRRYGIEIRNTNSHHNTIGYSGTAGNGVWAHDNRFHHNATGMTTDSFASGHPGMPQDCAKWEHNQIYSNNEDYFNDERDAYCRDTPIEKRDPTIVCPTFQVPVGTGIGIFGGNGDIARGNHIYDNWRDGVKLLYVPAALRGEPGKGVDTSFDNTIAGNRMGVRPDGTPDANGNDFWWDEQGRGNCWAGNAGPGGREPTSNVVLGLPGCPGSQVFTPGNPAKSASQASCATWDPYENPDPPGCDWFTRPAEPPDDGGSGEGGGLPVQRPVIPGS